MSDAPATEAAPAAFPTIGAAVEGTVDGLFNSMDSVESLCMECHEQGLTRMLLTYIPYFKEVIVVSFRCDHCGYSNNDIQAAGEIQPLGCTYTVKCTTRKDLNRQLVKADCCAVAIPEFQLQIPASKGQFTTVEGIISDTIRDLSQDQALRRVELPEVYDKIEALLDRLRTIVDQDSEEEMPVFTIKLDDPSGNSFIETEGGLSDPKWSKKEFERSKEQDEALGLAHEEKETQGIYPEEVHSFPSTCGLCGSPQETLMKTVNIPHFKDIILMSTNCHNCGYRDTEVKSGGATADKGRKITLKVEDSDDLSRDVLKSETAGLVIPEIDLELNPGTLGGRFTTLEGLLNQVYEELDEKVFAHGDSAVPHASGDMEAFLGKLKLVREAAIPFTIIIDDPMANSYIQNLYAPDEDPNMTTEVYERTHEQNEELGINDMKTEGYEQEEEEEVQEEGEKVEA